MGAEGVLPPLTDDEWPSAAQRMRGGFAGKLNVYRTMAHHPDLLLAWERFRDHVVLENALSTERLELVILRTGHRWGSAYEWAHHVDRGRKAGLSDAQIESARGPAGAADGEARLLFEAVDALLDNGSLEPALRARAVDLVGAAGVLDLMATVGMYSTLAFIANTFEVPIDPDVLEAADAGN
jgi:alkylhydroperoxidase family enzyme